MLLASSLVASSLAGCGPVIVGGAAVGASALYDRREHQVFLADQEIELRAIHALQQDRSIEGHSGISVTSYNKTVLLTGQAESEEVARHATQLVSLIAGVKRVIDEISIGPNISLSRESEDLYITSRAKLALTGIDLPDFNPTRVKVVTENGVVYLLGLVTPEEADAATEKVRYVPGVERVVKLFEYR
ncbi:BON domain-containing protein [Imhoffiella purpurea]|uniref:BON domain-containing protein n=1 Tax=Imhoffiella purpurea TaxID=1249627 RepID=UPI001E501480|nr:BON domain-containing protein [Imhoffiella purpurea]